MQLRGRNGGLSARPRGFRVRLAMTSAATPIASQMIAARSRTARSSASLAIAFPAAADPLTSAKSDALLVNAATSNAFPPNARLAIALPGTRIPGDRISGDRIPSDRSPGNRIPSDRSPGNRSLIDRSHVERPLGERISSNRSPIDRSHVERISSDRGYGDRNDVDRKIERSRIRLEPEWRPAPPRTGLERGVLLVSAGLIVGAAGCFWLLYNVFGAPLSVAPSQAVLQAPSTESYTAAVVVRSGKADLLARSAHPMMQQLGQADAIGAIDRIARAPVPDAPAKPANISGGSTRVAQPSSYFAPVPDRARGKDLAKDTNGKPPPMRLAALENPAPRSRSTFDPVIPRIPPDGDPKTTLVDFQTAPFPYDGRMPGSSRQFLDAGEAGHRGHTNFRGRTLWERDTYSDPRVLLHIPPGFDANKPSVMIVFFHGHGAILGRDVRDRQRVPAQISASGVNAVLVAPQFAVDAADFEPREIRRPRRIQTISRRGGRATRPAAWRSADQADLRQHADRDRGL